MRANLIVIVAAAMLITTAGPRAQTSPSKEEGLAAFETVRTVLQHPRCLNCHIPGNAPLQFDDGRPHDMNVLRGPQGLGAPGLGCVTCHGTANPPASFGARTPPGAPGWHLPPPDKKMVFIGLSSGALCRTVKDVKANGGKDLAALTEHVDHDKLVLWGWDPGVGRAPVSVPHDQFMAKWRTWVAAGAPCAP
jgi:hypothetical protein